MPGPPLDPPNTGGVTDPVVEETVQEAIDGDALAQSIKNLPKTWTSVQFNPPQHRGASGAYVANYRNDENGKREFFDANAGNQRRQILGPNTYQNRFFLKGVIYSHFAYPAERNYKGTDVSATDGLRYGMRFHYNPSSIQMGLGIDNNMVNISTIFSGLDDSMPIMPGALGGLSFTLFLNRIEDMMLLSPNGSGGKTPGGVVRPSAADMNYFYGRQLTNKEIDGIYYKGTGYDLEYLFRSVLGKPYNTMLRGETADIGIAFGVPQILDFSAGAEPNKRRSGLRYLGRVEQISYQHLSFNRKMVPLWTQVDITFTRYPDLTDKAPESGTKTPKAKSPGPQSPTFADNWDFIGVSPSIRSTEGPQGY